MVNMIHAIIICCSLKFCTRSYAVFFSVAKSDFFFRYDHLLNAQILLVDEDICVTLYILRAVFLFGWIKRVFCIIVNETCC